ncbi:MAG: gluconate 2-dehydrogenase subunit 3 family protein [Arcobacteraceae bacterium]|jgi:gluconate 2-dehydrogenase gamma chain|nr:gluconate 2-dehydrogenase subunit 3 family protein [Arcobacteraceae bacterium]
MTRRVFVKNSFLTVALLVFSKGKLFATVTPLQTIALLQEDLLPLLKQLQSNSALYVLKILNHSKISNADKQFIRNGVKWLNEEALTLYGNTYTKLSYEQRQALLQTISQTRWGDSFIYTMLKYGMEAILGDPIYEINTHQKGWKWLEHETGYPRPQKAFL